MQNVEGITPEILWYTLIGVVGIGSLIVLIDKVIDVFRKQRERKRQAQQPEDALAENISKKVLEKLEPRFKEIDRKLAADKSRIDEYGIAIGKHRDQLSEIEEGNKVLCRGILALLSHEINGNSDDKLRASQVEITNYLIDR